MLEKLSRPVNLECLVTDFTYFMQYFWYILFNLRPVFCYTFFVVRFIIRGIYRKSLFADWDRFPFEETYRTCVCVGVKESAGTGKKGREKERETAQ